jgi:hypothetical protein
MSHIDQFESVFRSAIKSRFRYQEIRYQNALLITDLAEEDSQTLLSTVTQYLAVLGGDVAWRLLTPDDYHSTQELLDSVDKARPDLICTYRNLHSETWKHPHSLGSHLDVLIQRTAAPVLVIPHPKSDYADSHAFEDTNAVMAITDHLAEDHLLVNTALQFCTQQSRLYIAHVEDAATFERYIEAIGKIPNIDTETARKEIADKLMEEPTAYIESCREQLARLKPSVEIRPTIEFGKHLRHYQDYISKFDIDLLVMHGKDNEQLAMHGLSYPLAIEIRRIPLMII